MYDHMGTGETLVLVRGLCVFALFCLFLIGPTAAATLTGKADIVDGDTIKIGGIPVRLYGIDAPESRQTCERNGKTYACGKQATKALANLIAGHTVQCEVVGRDAYARALGVCILADTEVNKTMVREGWALAFVKYSDRYAADQVAAELAEGRGTSNGAPDPPYRSNSTIERRGKYNQIRSSTYSQQATVLYETINSREACVNTGLKLKREHRKNSWGRLQ